VRIIRGLEEAPIEPLRGRTIAVIGFGNQGNAHARNLRDSGLEVVVGGREGSAALSLAEQAGFRSMRVAKAAEAADLVIIALPDEVQPEVYRREIEPSLRQGATIGFLHGFTIRFGLIQPREDLAVVLVAPKGPGVLLRERFVQRLGLPCLMAVHQDGAARSAEAVAVAWASGIGAARAGILCTTFAAEADSDLFGEQVVLCGGMCELMVAAFETLVAAGFDPLLAYLECCHEMKQIADLIYERGLAGMRETISNTAEFGGDRAGPRLIDGSVRSRMKELLAEIQRGDFAKSMREDHARGFPALAAQRRAQQAHPIEAAGAAVRALMGKTTAFGPGGAAR